jgi:hypothetical protein
MIRLRLSASGQWPRFPCNSPMPYSEKRFYLDKFEEEIFAIYLSRKRDALCGSILLRAADRYADRLWKHCLFCRDYLERRDIYILLAFALLCWRRPVSPHWRRPVASLTITLSITPQLIRLTPERGLFATHFKYWAAAGRLRVSAEIIAWSRRGVGCQFCNDFARNSLILSLPKDSLQNLSFHFLGLQVLGTHLPWRLQKLRPPQMVHSGILTLRQPYRDDRDYSTTSARTA